MTLKRQHTRFVMRRAVESGNVSQACREAGISRSLFYRWRQRYLATASLWSACTRPGD